MPGQPSSSHSSHRLRGSFVVVATVVSFLMAVGAGIGFTGYWWVQHKWGQGGFDFGSGSPSPVPGIPGSSPAVSWIGGQCEDTCNFLLLGSDSRATLSQKEQNGFQSNSQIGGYRSDTIMLVHIDGRTKHTTIVSFPRDLLVNVPGYGTNKINAAFNYGSLNGGGVHGGAKLSAETVSVLTGLDINHVLVVDLAGFQNIVDKIGYVPFCTPIPLKDDPQAYPLAVEGDLGSGLNLDHSGCYKLDGATALALVRARSVVSDGKLVDCVSDFARISRQQQFMRALLNRLLSPSMIAKVPGLIDTLSEQLTYDKGLTIPQLLDLYNALHGLASGSADFRTVPSEGGWATIGGVRQYVLNITPQGKELLGRLKTGQSLGTLGQTLPYQPPSPADIAVRVYDNDSEGHAQDDVYTAQLSEAGFKMMATLAEPTPSNLQNLPTTILYNKSFEEQAKVVANYVPGGYPIVQAKPGEIPDDTQVGVVVTAEYRHLAPGSGKAPSYAVSCPFHP